MRLVVLASGRGSNFKAIVEAIQNKKLNAEVIHLICNKLQAGCLEIAAQNRISFTVEKDHVKILTLLKSLNPDFICLAGYMRILPAEIIAAFPNKILNIHPSLLPKYKGLDAQKQALEAGETESGCTVHYVTEELDGGEILGQIKVAILPNDTVESLSERILEKEHELYVGVLKKISIL
ncbi:MAG: phosphoribosylglycinamide formyltransferase [Bacteroidia bacterium]|nr:phosphoribosylglycinamide formyltransferase [Bacteroidia bacterium]